MNNTIKYLKNYSYEKISKKKKTFVFTMNIFFVKVDDMF